MNVELLKPFNLCFKVLKYLGFWQDGSQSWSYFFIGYFNHFCVFELFIIAQILYLANIKSENVSLEDCVDLLRVFIVYISLGARSFSFIAKIGEITKAVENVKEIAAFDRDSSFVLKGHASRRLKTINKIIKIYWFCGFMATMSSICAGIISHELPVQIWLPFSTKGSEVWFYVTTCLLIVNISFMTTVAAVLDMLPLVFLCFIIGWIEELCDRLREVKTNDELIECVKIHIKIKKFVKIVHETFAFVILFDGFLSSTMLCICAFLLSTVSFIEF